MKRVDMMKDTDAQIIQTRIAASLEHRRQLAPALAAFAQELPPSRSRRELRRLANQLRTGATAEEIFASTTRHPTWLPLLMAAGKPPAEDPSPDSQENSGNSQEENFLQSLLTETARNQRILSEQTRVLAYPLVVLILALGILVFLCLVVVPGFGEIFSDFDLELPMMTQLVLNLSDLLRFHAGSLLLSALAILALAYLALRLVTTRGLLDHWLGFLSAGSSRDVASVALFTRRLANLLDADLALPSALRLASAGCHRGTLRRAANRWASNEEGHQTDHPGGRAPRGLPATLTAAVTDYRSQQKPNTILLRELAEMYAQWVQQRLDRSGGLVGTLTLWAAGLAVGFVVLSLFLPLVDLINGLTG
jgi:type II secretory pathway component PulF